MSKIQSYFQDHLEHMEAQERLFQESQMPSADDYVQIDDTFIQSFLEVTKGFNKQV